MSRVCYVCGKKPATGHRVPRRGLKPNIIKRVNRRWLPNLQRVHIQLENGGRKRVRVCTSCIRSGKVQKAVS